MIEHEIAFLAQNGRFETGKAGMLSPTPRLVSKPLGGTGRLVGYGL
jgi:hypothetical protein